MPVDELTATWSLVGYVRRLLAKELKPDGFNVGVNDGEAAGQTVRHAHVHVIPRYRGDIPDPRGGIRWINPSKAPYWQSPAKSIPEDADQVRFIRDVQRLLAQGAFVSTYKYALLNALADLCVQHGDGSGGELTLGTRDIARRVVELYWRQTLPFGGDTVLRQNSGAQAAILREINDAQKEHSSLAAFQNSAGWERLIERVDRRVRMMPLPRLQTVGNDRVTFLYEAPDPHARQITLKPGVSYCFRAYYDLILDLIRGGWLSQVRRRNAGLLGQDAELMAFLFGTERADLAACRAFLTDLQSASCFYCGARITESAEVDHFIPWSRYPFDLGHNFVVAHKGCNAQKLDQLAAEFHLQRWVERNQTHEDLISRELREVGFVCDVEVSTRVARWAYAEADRLGMPVWERARHTQRLTGSWRLQLAS